MLDFDKGAARTNTSFYNYNCTNANTTLGLSLGTTMGPFRAVIKADETSTQNQVYI